MSKIQLEITKEDLKTITDGLRVHHFIQLGKCVVDDKYNKKANHIQQLIEELKTL